MVVVVAVVVSGLVAGDVGVVVVVRFDNEYGVVVVAAAVGEWPMTPPC